MPVDKLQGAKIGPAPQQPRGMTPQQALGGIKSVTDGDGLTVMQSRTLQTRLHDAGVFVRPDYASTITGKMNGYTFVYAKLDHAWGAKETGVKGVAIAPDGNVYELGGKAGTGMIPRAGRMHPNAVELDFSKSDKPFTRVPLEMLKLP